MDMCNSSHSYNNKMLYVSIESSDDDHLTMEDLISYSFQVAKGMEFLSSRKVKLPSFQNLSVYTCRHPKRVPLCMKT